MKFRVFWSIDLEAGTPKQAAETAQRIQRDPESIATVFEVIPWSNNPPMIKSIRPPVMVDLLKGEV